MKRLILAALVIVGSCSAHGEVKCSGSPCVDSSGGVTSPVTVDPLSFTGVVTFDNAANTAVTLADGATGTDITGTTSNCGGAASGSANSVCMSSNTITGEGATADAFETLLAFGDATADQTMTCTGAASSYGCVVAAPAQVAASTAGNALALAASPATAGASVAGAAAGGSITITAGAAARLTSGNANGGYVNLVPGAGIGTGTAGLISSETAKPGIALASGAELTSLQWYTANRATWGGSLLAFSSGGAIILTSTARLGWAASTTVTTGTDVGILRVTAGVLRTADGSTGNGWLQQSAARSRVNADVTNATVTPANITGLSATLIAGRKYTGELILFCDDSTAADGISFDFDGGTATMTSFAAQGIITDTLGVRNLARSAALATDLVDATTTGSTLARINFSFVVNAAGTFIPRFFQSAHTTGTATVTLGSYMWLEDTP